MLPLQFVWRFRVSAGRCCLGLRPARARVQLQQRHGAAERVASTSNQGTTLQQRDLVIFLQQHLEAPVWLCGGLIWVTLIMQHLVLEWEWGFPLLQVDWLQGRGSCKSDLWWFACLTAWASCCMCCVCLSDMLAQLISIMNSVSAIAGRGLLSVHISAVWASMHQPL